MPERRLSAQKRRIHRAVLDTTPEKADDIPFRALYKDALHDLDVADKETAENYKTIFKEIDRYKDECIRSDKLEIERDQLRADERVAAFKDAFEEAVGLVVGCSKDCDCEGILKRRLACIP